MRNVFLSFLVCVLFFVHCTSNENPLNGAKLDVTINSEDVIDSLIVYDKENSWDIMSCYRFANTKMVADTLQATQNKIYKMYFFTDGMQRELGEIYLGPNSKNAFQMDKNDPYASINFQGTHAAINNYFAYARNLENILSEQVKNGISQEDLQVELAEKKEMVLQKGKKEQITDSLIDYANNKFEKFSSILVKKNSKYLYKRSLIGADGNNFVFQDANKKPVSLQDYKGKYVYIDVWATWCKPCKEEYVYLKDVEEYFSETDAIAILSVSIDKDFSTWYNYLTSALLEGTQLHCGLENPFVAFYDIGALPRFLFLDKEGKVISADEIRPSNERLKSYLQGYLKK